MMKRFLKYVPIVILALASCSRETLPEAKTTENDDHCIVLTFGNVHPALETKASVRGDTLYNESAVRRVDCFFYPTGATGSNAVFSAIGRGAEVVKVQQDSLEYKVKIFFTDDDAVAMFGSATSGQCEVYVICNAPLSYGSNTSVPALKELVLEHDFSAQVVMGSFAMHSNAPETVELTTENEVSTATGRVHVSRSAAKIQLFMQIPERMWDEENKKYWYPLLDNPGAQIRMRYLVKRGKVDGSYTPVASDLVTTPYRLFAELPTARLVPGRTEYNYSHSPFYSYPTSWHDLSEDAPFFVFRIPWQMEGSTSYEYRVYQLSPNLAGKKFEPNHYYRSYVKISSLGGVDEDHSVVIPDCSYFILPWFEEGANAGQGVVPAEFMDYKFLVIDVPEVVLNNEEKAYFSYVSSGAISSVNITKIIYYDNSKADPKQTLTSGTAFNTAKASISIDYSNPGVISFTHLLADIYSQWVIYATVTNEDGISADVIITQNPPIRLLRQSDKSGDVFVNGFFGHVKNATFGGTHRPYLTYHSTSNRDSQYYGHCNTGWSNDNNQQVSYNYNNTYKTGIYGTVMGGFYNLDNTISRDFFTTYINISSFNATNHNNEYYANGEYVEYRIGDPRVEASTLYGNDWQTVTNFYNYLTSDGPTSKAWESPEKIMVTSQAVVDRNLIAPQFLVSSGLNATATGNMTFDFAVKRAATYQEAGYPAGRWRLPTEAEMAFIVARQNDGTIPNLYATGTKYWAGSGRLLQPASGGAINFSNDDGSGHSCRFVYDLWYWGNEASTTNVYHPDGHLYDYDASGNKTPRTL